jgi:hypothetical protein
MITGRILDINAYASWQKGGIENASGRLRRWLPRHLDIDRTSDQDIQEIVLTTNLTPRKCLGFKTPFQALIAELGKGGSNPPFLSALLEVDLALPSGIQGLRFPTLSSGTSKVWRPSSSSTSSIESPPTLLPCAGTNNRDTDAGKVLPWRQR